MSHALCQKCRGEDDTVLALDVPTIKLKRQHMTFPFVHYEAVSITNGTDLLSIVIEWFPNPDPTEQQTKVFESHKKVRCLVLFLPRKRS